MAERYADEVGMDPDQADALRAASEASKKQKEAEAEALKAQIEAEAKEDPASVDGKLIRFAGPPVAVGGAAKDTNGDLNDGDDVNPASARPLDVEGIVKNDGLAIYKDQAGRLWSGLATYWTKRGEFDRASSSVHLS